MMGTVIIPVCKATIALLLVVENTQIYLQNVVGTHYPMAGGSGGGVCLTPMGFLINTKKEIKYISTNESNYQKIIEGIANLSEFIVEKLSKGDKK